MKDHHLIWSNNKAIFNVISDNIVWRHKVNILSVNFRSDYIIYCPFQMQKQIFLHSLAIWHENIKPLDLIVKKLPNSRPKLSPNLIKNDSFKSSVSLIASLASF